MKNVPSDEQSAHPNSFSREGYQEPLLPSEEYEVNGQTLLLCGGTTASVSASEDEEEPDPSGEVDALLAELQCPLPLEGDHQLPACKRSAESQALPTWHQRSTRREDLVFEHPPEHADLRRLGDQALGARWGWVSKHRGRGLSSRDEAIQREVYARCLGVHDLYGLDWSPRASASNIEALRAMGCGGPIARDVMALLELTIARGRMGLRLSAPEARTVLTWSISGWWKAIARLEELGVLVRVGSIKVNEDGPAPVQTDSNIYVLGPWWFEGIEGVTPLESALGLLAKREGKPTRAAKVVHERVMGLRRGRRRAHSTITRDRNRRRHHGLEPRATSTAAVIVEADRLARKRGAEIEAQRAAQDRERGRALMEGRGVTLRESRADVPLDVPSSQEAEAAAVAHVEAENRGDPRGAGSLRRAVRTLGEARDSQDELPSTKWSAFPKGKIEGKLVLSRERDLARETSSTLDDPDLKTKAGDKSGQRNSSLGDRARALDGKARDRRPSQDDAVFRDAFASLFGRSLEPEELNSWRESSNSRRQDS